MNTSTSSEFEIHQDGSILTISLNAIDRGNSLTGSAASALADILDEVSLGNNTTRAVLLRSNGKHFCTGAALGGPHGGDKPVIGHMVRNLAKNHHRLIESLFHCRVPTVAAIQGRAMGFGCHLALATDFTICSSLAIFNEPFSQRGFSVDSGGSWLLPRLIGISRAKQMIYLSEDIDALRASEWGLVTKLVSPTELEATALELVQKLANSATQAIAASKRLLNAGALSDLTGALHDESMAVELTIRSNDFKEGMTAFAKKRPPQFTGT